MLPPDSRKKLFRGILKVLRNGGWFINADIYARNDQEKHLIDLAGQLLHFDVFRDDPEYRRKWTIHYLGDENIRFSESE